MGRIHAECVSLPAEVFTRALLAIEPPDPDCAAALDLLRQWDCRMDRDQVQPTIYAQPAPYLATTSRNTYSAAMP